MPKQLRVGRDGLKRLQDLEQQHSVLNADGYPPKLDEASHKPLPPGNRPAPPNHCPMRRNTR
jgi:hypothetical protein